MRRLSIAEVKELLDKHSDSELRNALTELLDRRFKDASQAASYDAKSLKRLLRSVVKNGSCWLFSGAKDPDGYGLIWYLDRQRFAHRLSYVLHMGKIDAGLHVLHSCDQRACVNPEHLRLGTNSDNVRDRELRNPAVKNPNTAIFKRKRK